MLARQQLRQQLHSALRASGLVSALRASGLVSALSFALVAGLGCSVSDETLRSSVSTSGDVETFR